MSHRRRWSRRLDTFRRRIDDVRVREHLRRAERELRAADPDLSPATRERRERALDALRAYRQRGAFPRNPHGERTPCFVGRDGTACAVGAMALADGRDELVARIAHEDNTVRIEDCEDAALLGWIREQGLTREEAARIQPTYPSAVEFATTCGPLPCWLAGVVASTVGLAAGAAAEWVGYRVAGDLFPDNTLKRRGALAYFTALALFTVPLVAALAYALFP